MLGLGLTLSIGTGTVVSGGGGGATAVTWDPAHKDADVTLSLGNTVAATTDGVDWANVLGTLGKSTGKWYFEVVNQVTPFGNSGVGVANLSASLTNFMGNDANSVGFLANGSLYFNGVKQSTYGTFINADTIGCAFDADNHLVWFSINNTWQAGNPSTGTSPGFTAALGAYYPAFVGESATQLLLHANASNLTYTPPTGFSALGG